MSSEVQLRMHLADRLVREAGDQILDAYHQDLRFELKGLHDYVSELDINIEKYIKTEVSASFPEDSVYGEETHKIQGNSDWQWIVDPIDGTNNFRRGLPMAGSQIALVYKGDIVYSCIFQPFVQEFYWAQRSKGAFCKNLLTRKSFKLSVSNRTMRDSFVIYDSGVMVQDGYSTHQMNRLRPYIEGGRVLGVAVMDFPAVASGGAELLISSIGEAYDIAPGLLLVEEAGGKVTNLKGGKWDNQDKIVIVGNGIVNDELSLGDENE